MSQQSTAAYCQQRTMIEIQKLASAIESMDGLAEEGLTGIFSIAQLALESLETPDGYTRLHNVINALIAIRGIADTTQRNIKGEAEFVNCQCASDAKQKRLDAQQAHQQAAGA